eukprot:2599945-Rhodomonas_salina.1
MPVPCTCSRAAVLRCSCSTESRACVVLTAHVQPYQVTRANVHCADACGLLPPSEVQTQAPEVQAQAQEVQGLGQE